MMSGTQLAWDDTVLPFQLDAPDIRGRVARLDGVLEGILRQHDYPAPVEALVAEMALLTALIGQAIKVKWKLSLQVQSKGAVRMIATDYYGPEADGKSARIRAYASYDPERITDASAFEQIGEGYFAILIDQGKGMTPYQGITPLAGGSLAACAEEQARYQTLVEAARASQEAADLSYELYDRGGKDFLNVLVSQRALYASQDELVQSETAVITNLIALYKALGGGWETRLDDYFVPDATRRKMGERTDWGDLLDVRFENVPARTPDGDLWRKPDW